MQTEDALLSEIPSLTVKDLILPVLEDIAPLGPTFITSLDGLFTAGTDGQQQGQDGILKRGITTEIQGKSKSGKTTLVAFFLMTFLLPKNIRVEFTRDSPGEQLPRQSKGLDVFLGGRGSGSTVVLFDNDGRFPIQRLRRMMLTQVQNRIKQTVHQSGAFDRTGSQPWQPPSKEHLLSLIEGWLGGLKVLRPLRREEFLAAIVTARRISPGNDIDLIVVDSISTFWFDEKAQLEKRLHGGGQAAQNRSRPLLTKTLQALAQLQEATAAPLIMTNHALEEQTAPNRPVASYRPTATASLHGPHSSPLPGGRWWEQHLPCPPYSTVHTRSLSAAGVVALQVDLHITLQPTLPQPFPIGTTERAARVDTWRSQTLEQLQVVGWLRSLRDGFLGRFAFRVKDDGITVSATV